MKMPPPYSLATLLPQEHLNQGLLPPNVHRVHSTGKNVHLVVLRIHRSARNRNVLRRDRNGQRRPAHGNVCSPPENAPALARSRTSMKGICSCNRSAGFSQGVTPPSCAHTRTMRLARQPFRRSQTIVASSRTMFRISSFPSRQPAIGARQPFATASLFGDPRRHLLAGAEPAR